MGEELQVTTTFLRKEAQAKTQAEGSRGTHAGHTEVEEEPGR